ncbi:MAG TPA: condensation domain-containing protein, partial [Longimicrobiaceae bacterium]
MTIPADLIPIESPQHDAEDRDAVRVPGGVVEYEVFPASFAQERLWLVQRLDGGSHAYHLFRAFRVHGRLDGAALERAFAGLVRRHESLRTTFREEDGHPVQVIAPFAGFALAVEEVSGEDVRRRLAEESARAFDLRAGPLFRAGVLRAGDEEHVLWMAMHHIASDGWSMEILYRELAALYATAVRGDEAPLPELPLQYADWAVWQRERLQGDALERELAWWRERLAGAPALLELPADHPRPPMQTYRGAQERFELAPGLAERLEALARGEGATLYMVLLAAFQVLLAKYAGTDDVVAGSPVAGRTHRDVEPLVGFFANLLVLRTDLSGDPSFREVLRRVRAVALGALDHQEVPFEKLVAELQPERTLSHAPLVQSVFALEGAGRAAGDWPGVRLEPVEIEL